MKPHIEFTATVTIGILRSVAITDLKETWIDNGNASDWVSTDLEDCSPCDWCEHFDGWDYKEGIVKISGKAICDGDECIDGYVEYKIERIS